MKNNKSIYMLVLLVLAYMFISKNSEAQFVQANVGENSVSGSGSAISPDALITGNDILNFSGGLYAVSVWDDFASNEPGIGWRVTIGGNSYNNYSLFAQTSGVFEADVCLIENGTDVFAIAVYVVDGATDTYYWEPFRWTGGGTNAFVSGGANSMSTGTVHGSTLNIDGNDAGDFVIVWDSNAPNVVMVSGSTGTGNPALNQAAFTAITGVRSPDVSVYRGSTGDVYVTYLSGGNLYVDYEDLATVLAGGFGSPTSVLSNVAPNYTFYNPRIATPNGASSGWTVVVEDNNGTNVWEIDGYNDCCGGNPTAEYTAYSGFLNISGYPNLRPVVTYDDQSGPNIWIGWIMDNSIANFNGATATAIYPIVVKCDNDAKPVNTDYWEAPRSSGLSNGDEIDFLSLSGRYATNRLFVTFADVGASDVFHKGIGSIGGAGSLKLMDDISANEFSEQLIPYSVMSDITGSLTMNIFDLNGIVVYRTEGNWEELITSITHGIENLTHSVFIAQVFSDDGSVYFTKKIFTGN